MWLKPEQELGTFFCITSAFEFFTRSTHPCVRGCWKRSPALRPFLQLSPRLLGLWDHWRSLGAGCSSFSVALPGIIWCQILEGHLEEAAHQLEFLKEVQQSLGTSEVSTPRGRGLPRSVSAAPPTPSL